MACQVLREEFRLKNFAYKHPEPSAFYRCQWRWPAWLYLSIRLCLALYVVGAFIAELVHYYNTAVNHGSVRNINTPISSDDTSAAGSNVFYTTNNTEPKLSPTGRPAPRPRGWDTRRPWYVFFTYWSFTLLMVHFVLAAILSVAFSGLIRESVESTLELTNSKNTLKLPEDEEEKPLYNIQYQDAEANFGTEKNAQSLAWYFKISWILSDIVTPSAPIVSIVYFGAIYRGGPLGVSSINVHILNFVFVLIDQLVCARPVKLLHIVTPVAFSAIYTVFNVVYWLFDRVEHVLYRGVIDWNDPGLSLKSIALMSFILLSLVMIFWFVLYRLKLCLFSKLYGRI